MQKDFKYREIPYNYTSFSDKEIVLKYFDRETWDDLKYLRDHRKTGRSAKLLFKTYGDYFVIDRNPYIFNNFLENAKKLKYLQRLHRRRLSIIEKGAYTSKGAGDRVISLLEKTRKVDEEFFANFDLVKKKRERVLSSMSSVTAKGNIRFDAFHKVAHSTDATDFRVEIPFVVVYPDNVSELGSIVSCARSLSLKVIPRGGGTGLTGAAVPIVRDTVVINMEKLSDIHGIGYVKGESGNIPVISLDAGVVTQDAMDFAKGNGLIFSTDPTSSWACTVGGNLAMNSGGKKAVIWGTAIDNIYSFKMVIPSGRLIEVVRRNHPYRKILPDDDVKFDVYYEEDGGRGELIRTISLSGRQVRKPGIGKDVTNKALGGVPGIQKEGGDGIIVSCKYILHKPFLHKRTLCLEFFGSNMLAASQSIVEIKELFARDERAYLTALEHFDDKYIKAIVYKNKSGRMEEPKAVLLIDIESDNEEDLSLLVESVMSLTVKYNTESILAQTASERELFWKDRKNLGAIAKDTNAFKLNEDVVIEVDKLPIFADFVDNINIKKDLISYIAILDKVEKEILDNISSFSTDNEDDFLSNKLSSVRSHLSSFRDNYVLYRDNLNESAEGVFADKYSKADGSIFDLFQRGELKLDFEDGCLSFFRKSFYGHNAIVEALDFIVSENQSKKIVVATHMHAGDGNIHVNIPVHSNDYDMMQEANETVALVIEKTKELGGVISGEHGIGLAKLEFLDEDIIDEYSSYKAEADPDNLFNPGKLSKGFSIDSVYTPSFNLLKLEAFILKVTDLEDLSLSIAPCLRCGRCKGVCNTHYPKATIFFNPRDKVQGVALIVEAVLYEAHAFNELSFRHFNMLREISDHCTLCHKCEVPCPVNIDFGEVTLAIRKLLVDRRKNKFKLMTWLTLNYLRTKGYYVNRLLRLFFVKFGFKAQSIGHYINKPFSRLSEKLLPKINYLLKSPYPSAGDKDIRELLDLKGDNTFFCFQSPKKNVGKSVFYFPGCGSERMFPEISMATIALLYHRGVQVVIPPLYLCCGFPLLANGKTELAELTGYENRVVFHKIADTMSYAGIKDVIISCGTCYEMLDSYELSNIFEGSKLVEINEFIIREKFLDTIDVEGDLLYHDPCHSPIKGMSYDEAFEDLFNKPSISSPNCCGDGGTLALSTPELSYNLRERKQNFIKEDVKCNKTVATPKQGLLGAKKETVLTTCPSCVQGLSKIKNGVNVEGKHLAVFLAEKTLGKNWKRDFIKELKQDSSAIEHILI